MCSLKDLCISRSRMDLDIFSCALAVLNPCPPSPLSRICRSLLSPFSMSGYACGAAECIREFPLQCSHIQSVCVCVCVCIGQSAFRLRPQCLRNVNFSKSHLCNLNALALFVCPSSCYLSSCCQFAFGNL